ncbi:hypothetical protein HD554DRAFT_2034415 [Boletus coccyginus]|nr:hypothetical protein HD554DRAFT_2034415 [Boletus coccyginus]
MGVLAVVTERSTGSFPLYYFRTRSTCCMGDHELAWQGQLHVLKPPRSSLVHPVTLLGLVAPKLKETTSRHVQRELYVTVQTDKAEPGVAKPRSSSKDCAGAGRRWNSAKDAFGHFLTPDSELAEQAEDVRRRITRTHPPIPRRPYYAGVLSFAIGRIWDNALRVVPTRKTKTHNRADESNDPPSDDSCSQSVCGSFLSRSSSWPSIQMVNFIKFTRGSDL